MKKIITLVKNAFQWLWAHKRWSLGGLIVIVVGGFFLIQKFGGKNSEIMYMSNEYTVEKGDIIQNLNLAGTTQFANSQKLGFVSEGKVTAVYVKVGDQVRKDEVLAVISAESLDREINNMKKNINKSKEDYEKMIRENNENRVFDIKQAEIAQQTAITELAALPARQKIEVENIEQNIKEKKENYDK